MTRPGLVGACRRARRVVGGGVNEIVVTCPVCTLEVLAMVVGAGLVLVTHLVPGTRFPCPQGGTMLTSCADGSWRGRRMPDTSASPPGCP
jgi:hypothetical protein